MNLTTPESSTPRHPLRSLVGILSAICGWTLSRYCGAAIWIPGIAILLLMLVFAKTPVHPKYFAGAIATTAAHVIWFFVGSVATGNFSAAGLDILLLTGGIAWLWWRPGLPPALFLGLVQLVSLISNVASLLSSPYGSEEHRLLTVHCVLRLVALISLVAGYRKMRHEISTAALKQLVEDF